MEKTNDVDEPLVILKREKGERAQIPNVRDENGIIEHIMNKMPIN